MNFDRKKYKKYLNLIILWLPIIIYRISFWASTEVYVFPDSEGYIGYVFSNLFYGRLSDRTPIYPLVIRILLKMVGETYYLEAVTICQSIVSLIAVVYFYRICKLFSINRLITVILVYLYGFNTSIIVWDSVRAGSKWPNIVDRN